MVQTLEVLAPACEQTSLNGLVAALIVPVDKPSMATITIRRVSSLFIISGFVKHKCDYSHATYGDDYTNQGVEYSTAGLGYSIRIAAGNHKSEASDGDDQKTYRSGDNENYTQHLTY